MIDTDPARAARRIERLSWVASASVSRQWPGTVRVRVIERRAVAAVPARGGWAAVDAAGRVLERTTDPPPNLGVIVDAPPIAGDQVPPRLHDALAVAAALPPRMLDRVAGVAARSGGLELLLRPKGVARLGGTEQLREKLTALETMLARVQGPMAVIDVRVPDAPVLTRE
jgi:cell division protein FtsQ